jgi:hypothetical protein
MHDKE